MTPRGGGYISNYLLYNHKFRRNFYALLARFVHFLAVLTQRQVLLEKKAIKDKGNQTLPFYIVHYWSVIRCKWRGSCCARIWLQRRGEMRGAPHCFLFRSGRLAYTHGSYAADLQDEDEFLKWPHSTHLWANGVRSSLSQFSHAGSTNERRCFRTSRGTSPEEPVI